jgi:ribosomal protein S11
MKKIVMVSFFVLVCASFAFASSMVATQEYLSNNKSVLLIKVVATADADGTFSDKLLNEAALDAGLQKPYDKEGFYLAHAWVVNSATNDHTNAAVVTITDGTGQVIIGAASGDTLTLSQVASGIAYLSAARSAAQRAVTSNLIIAIADTGASATVQTLYLLLVR